MEVVEMNNLFGGIYKGKKVLVTGHTGFKGSWLILWLKEMGADVYGLALDPPTKPNHYDLLNISMGSHIQDIRDLNRVKKILLDINPDIIFHLAAQSLVRNSYKDPVSNFTTNVIGTVNILEASRPLTDLKAVVVITSDKCYENKEWLWGYREYDAMGGKDPYSSSKGCAELVTSAYRHLFFSSCDNDALVASARAGNVIGGGDWAKDRILTDIVESASKSDIVYLRNPAATRPWQHVLEPLSGYLMLGWKLLEEKREFASAWNFGPEKENNVTVLDLVKKAQKSWNSIRFDVNKGDHPYEAGFLMLDSTKANKLLGWKPVWSFDKTVENTIKWYKQFYENKHIISRDILNDYITDAQKMSSQWIRI
jgi:CDP-glucose 4,6-dehydratase